MVSVIRDVVLWLAMVLVIGIRVLFLDGCNLGMSNAFDLMAVREVRVVRGGDVIVGIVGRGGLQVLVRSHLEVVGGLAVVIGGVVVEFVFALGNHVPGFLPVCEPPHGLSWALA